MVKTWRTFEINTEEKTVISCTRFIWATRTK